MWKCEVVVPWIYARVCGGTAWADSLNFSGYVFFLPNSYKLQLNILFVCFLFFFASHFPNVSISLASRSLCWKFLNDNNDNRGRHLEFYFHTHGYIGNWVQCFPVYPGLNSSSGSGFRLPAFPYAPDFSFTCIFPFLWLLYCEVLMMLDMLVCNSKKFQFLNELHELNQAFFHSQVVNSDRVERKKNVTKIWAAKKVRRCSSVFSYCVR